MGVKYRTIRERKHVLSGGILNPYFPLKLGIACVGGVNSKDYPKELNKWRGMIERCYDPKHSHYKTYGGAGIVVCDRWLCFEYFLADLPFLDGYDEEKIKNGELDIDKDTKGDRKQYCPASCVFISPIKNIKEMNKRVKQKAVIATRLSDGLEFTFYNQTKFAESHGFDQANISRCLSGDRKTAGGFTFKLLEEK